ncbi:MAG: SBBP repeat-containing protein [Candidatus Jettenia caeni]|nr:MAG: SBBP repeat-containing protein [Candidatus Jettenia caeni]
MRNILHGCIFRLFLSIAALYLFSGVSIINSSAFGLSLTSANQSNRYASVDDAAKVKAQENYGKLPFCFIQNKGQVNGSIKFYEKQKGYSIFFTKRGIYVSFASNHRLREEKQETEGRSHLLKTTGSGEAHDKNPSVSTKSPFAFTKSPFFNKPTHTLFSNKSPQSPFSKTFTHFSPFSKRGPRGITQGNIPQNSQEEAQTNNPCLKIETIKLIPLGANKHLEIIPEGLQETKVNYLIGTNPEDWKTNIPTYQAIVYKDMYQDIDMRFYGNNRQLEYDIIIKPGANPSRIKFAYRGIENLRINKEGDLEIYLKNGKMAQKKPYIYQEINGKRVEVKGGFAISGLAFGVQNTRHTIRDTKHETQNTGHFVYGFRVASYDKRYPLTIDPALVYSTYLGGNNSDEGYKIAVDSLGNAYITGETRSDTFPAISALYKNKIGDARFSDVFVTKLNASGTRIVYSTYLGGNSDDIGNGIAVDSSGNVSVTGFTNSTNFPTVMALYKNKEGESDAFITKINASGDNLVYSTYLGGSSSDWGRGIAVDTFGNAYITGWTYSNNFPTVSTIMGSKTAGYQDAFITKINPSGSELMYSLYLGGNNYDTGNGIAVDTFGNAYVTGYTNSTNFPIVSAIHKSYAGGYHDAFITKINPSGNKLVYSTYLGGSGDDIGYEVAVDVSGNAYITGLTWSNNFPTTLPLYKNIAGNNDVFITKLNTAGTVIYSTYLGGSMYESGHGIAADISGNAYITGVTRSDDFPVTSALYERGAGNNDAFIVKLNAAGNKLLYSLYLGGDNEDAGYGVAVDTEGNAYVAGRTESDNFPVISAVYGNKTGDHDAFITKIALMKGKIYGYVADSENSPVGYASIVLKGTKAMSRFILSDENGSFQFRDLDADMYTISAMKKGYEEARKKVGIEEDKVKVIMLRMKKKQRS